MASQLFVYVGLVTRFSLQFALINHIRYDPISVSCLAMSSSSFLWIGLDVNVIVVVSLLTRLANLHDVLQMCTRSRLQRVLHMERIAKADTGSGTERQIET